MCEIRLGIRQSLGARKAITQVLPHVVVVAVVRQTLGIRGVEWPEQATAACDLHVLEPRLCRHNPVNQITKQNTGSPIMTP